MFRPLVIYVTTPPRREHEPIIATIDAVTAVDGINANALGLPANRVKLLRRRGRTLVHVIAGPDLDAAATLARRRSVPLVVSVPRGWDGTLPEEAALVVVSQIADAHGFDPQRVRVIDFERPTAGARAADLEEHWVSLARNGAPAVQRDPIAETPDVAVVVVTFNRAALLEETLQALEAQSYPRRALSVCVVDNASTDETQQLLERWSTRSWLSVIRYDEHQPVVAARNAAVAATSGGIVAFTDDDCRPAKHWVRSLVAAFSSDVAIVQGKTMSDQRASVGPLSRTQVMPAEAGLYETCNIAYRRETFEAVNGFDTTFAAVVKKTLGSRIGQQPFGEDTELAWRAKHAGAVSRFASDAIVEHHVFPGDPGYLMKRSMISAAFPLLLKRIPELRSDLLTYGFLLGQRRALWWLAVLGVALSFVTPWALIAVLPYLRKLIVPRKPQRWRRVRVLPFQIARDLVESLALIYGSIRAGCLVL